MRFFFIALIILSFIKYGLVNTFVALIFCWWIWIELKLFFSPELSKSYSSSKASGNERVISCPSCSQKLRIRLPLITSLIKCSKCSSRFELKIDENGNIYINKTNENKRNRDTINQPIDLEYCFALLDITPQATSSEIKSAYKKKIMEYHPDKVEKLGARLKMVAEEESKRINAAYSALQKNGLV